MNTILPPLVIDVRVREPGKRGFRIWFPFVILWPLLFLIVGFLLLITVLVDMALLIAGAEYHHYTLLVLSTFRLLAYTRGTHARVNSSDSTLVYLDVY
jgi:hypothetical protein